MAEPAGFVPPPYPYDRLDRLAPLAGAARRWRRRSVDRHAVRSTDRQRDRRAVDIERRAWAIRRASAPMCCGRRSASWLARRFDLDVPIGQVAACVGTKEFVATTPQYLRLRTPSKDTVLYPGGRLPDLRDGGDAVGLPRVPVPCRADGALDLSAIAADRRRPCVDAVGQQPVESHWRAHRSGRGRGVGTSSRRAGVQRRVLRRVHLGRPGEHDPASRARRCRRRALAVEALQPRRPARRLLRRRCRASSTTSRRSASTSACWCPVRRRLRPRSPSATTHHVTVQRDRYRGASSDSARCSRRGQVSTSRCRPGASTCGSTPATAGSSPSDWPEKEGRW